MPTVEKLLKDLSCNVDASLTRTQYYFLKYTNTESNDPVDVSQTAFSWACSHGQVHVVELLLKSPRIDPSKKSNYETTPLNNAAYRGRDEVIKLLLRDPRIDVNDPNKYGYTPFIQACQRGHLNVAFLLVSELRVDVKRVSDEHGVPPVVSAAFFGHQNLLGMLLTSDRIDPNQTNALGASPLYMAAYFGHLSCVQRILACGRPIDTQRGYKSLTPVAVALAAPTRQRYLWDTDEGMARAKRNSKVIANLITDFERNPSGVIAQLRTQREWSLFSQKDKICNNFLFVPVHFCSSCANPCYLCDQCPNFTQNWEHATFQ